MHKRVSTLLDRGVKIVDPYQIYVSDDVDLDRVSAGAVLYPGTRLAGEKTFVGDKAKVGTEGPASLVNVVLAADAEVASGYVEGAVLLCRARLGSNAHVRRGTLLEEHASTAHAVGLKQTILMAHVTTGSLINLCDALVSGGRSRSDHTEIGSGFVHFNYTPFGPEGDKATPTLIGDVENGALLREDRIFLGGLSGIVGPGKVGFGAFTVAGQIIREEVPDRTLFGSIGRRVLRDFDRSQHSKTTAKISDNLRFLGQLHALKAWYSEVRLLRERKGECSTAGQTVIGAALVVIDECISERLSRLNSFVQSVGLPSLEPSVKVAPCPLSSELLDGPVEHLDWVRALSTRQTDVARSWLRSIAQSVANGSGE
jgi:hypothetical protein